MILNFIVGKEYFSEFIMFIFELVFERFVLFADQINFQVYKIIKLQFMAMETINQHNKKTTNIVYTLIKCN